MHIRLSVWLRENAATKKKIKQNSGLSDKGNNSFSYMYTKLLLGYCV